jgi:hypothetical protein
MTKERWVNDNIGGLVGQKDNEMRNYVVPLCFKKEKTAKCW